MAEFLAKLSQVIVDERLIPRRSSILLSVSGGLDSMTLLSALAQLQPRFSWQLQVAHFNHHLRRRAADADQRFVERQCKKLKIPCSVGHWDSEAKAAAIKKHGVERAAREARLRFLNSTATRLRIRRVITAHHADDQVELFFVRLLRGAGSKGLGGMSARSQVSVLKGVTIVRPLLRFTRGELQDWATKNDVRFREDATNADSRYLRNRVRHALLPVLEQRFSIATKENILRTMRILRDESDWLRAEARKRLASRSRSLVNFDKLHPALQRQMLVLQLEKLELRFDAALVERLRQCADVQINSPGNCFISRDHRGRIQVHQKDADRPSNQVRTISLSASHGNHRIDNIVLDWSKTRSKNQLDFGAGREFFDAAAIGTTVTIRHWRAGDRFQPIGMSQAVKVQNLFTNAKVPRNKRHQRLLATTARGEIFWVEGLRIGERFKVTSQTKTYLVWHWREVS